jgi:hypothetical protein
MERSIAPGLRWQYKITGIGKTSCKDLPLHPFREGRAVRRAPPCPEMPCIAQNTPCHGTESQIPSSQCQRSNHQAAKRPANAVSIDGLPPCECRMHRRPGGARRDRTDDLLLAKQALSQLSYGPGRSRVTERWQMSVERSVPQVRARDCGWWAWVDSNYRPHAYQACALTRLSYRPNSRESRRSQNNPERKRNEDGETRLMGPDTVTMAPDFSIDASIARATCP